MKKLASQTICKDGTKLSIQASKYHYSSPKEDAGYIQTAEGAQVIPPETWRYYSDGNFPSDVYGYVPRELVEAFIKEHGGALTPEVLKP